jgi:hypothetical protein
VIKLKVDYDKATQMAIIECESDSRNKCGLHNFKIMDSKGIILTKRFPFLKKKISVKLSRTPDKMVFFLRKIPEHSYNVLIK